jgi:hypothetical protein
MRDRCRCFEWATNRYMGPIRFHSPHSTQVSGRSNTGQWTKSCICSLLYLGPFCNLLEYYLQYAYENSATLEAHYSRQYSFGTFPVFAHRPAISRTHFDIRVHVRSFTPSTQYWSIWYYFLVPGDSRRHCITVLVLQVPVV